MSKNIKILCPAETSDIKEGNTVYLIYSENSVHTKIIESVLKPDDKWKAFSANDGSRYGLENLWVLRKISKKRFNKI